MTMTMTNSEEPYVETKMSHGLRLVLTSVSAATGEKKFLSPEYHMACKEEEDAMKALKPMVYITVAVYSGTAMSQRRGDPLSAAD
jgi:hypothetical protein